MNTINEYLSLAEFESIIFGNNKVVVSDVVLNRVNESFNFLKEFSGNKVIYGVNTGFGPMAQYRIKESDQIQLQYNLIRSHSSGTGKPLSPVCAKAAGLARLNTLSLGNSGVHPSVIHLHSQNITQPRAMGLWSRTRCILATLVLARHSRSRGMGKRQRLFLAFVLSLFITLYTSPFSSPISLAIE